MKTIPAPMVVIPETREAESSGIYFLQWFQVDPGQLAPLASGMTAWVWEVKGPYSTMLE